MAVKQGLIINWLYLAKFSIASLLGMPASLLLHLPATNNRAFSFNVDSSGNSGTKWLIISFLNNNFHRFAIGPQAETF